MPNVIKSIFGRTAAEALYGEIASGYSNYYHFVGKTVSWTNDTYPPTPVDSTSYEKQTRNEIAFLKQVAASNVAVVAARRNWSTGTVYDKYDDEYSTTVIGLNLTSGGTGYASAPTITIGEPFTATSWSSGGTVTVGSYVKYTNAGGTNYWIVSSGTTLGSSAPTHTSGSAVNGTATLTYVGTRATATCSLTANSVSSITMTNRGNGYTTVPTVTFSSGAASATAVIGKSNSGAQLLKNASYYVLADTTDYRVYICLNNNSGGQSTVKPTGTSTSPFTTADGYVWQYVGTVPSSFRSKFMTPEYIPLNNMESGIFVQGIISSIEVVSGGYGYTSTPTVTIVGNGSGATATATVVGNKITAISVTSYGSGYDQASIVISGGGGVGAVARAIVGPHEGFGKFPSRQIQANTALLYTEISSRDSVSGFFIQNECRQTGLIKNPTQYNSTDAFTGSAGTPCWTITSASSISNSTFPNDTTLWMNTDSTKRFRIVANSGDTTSALGSGTSILAQSLDDYVPTTATIFAKSTATTNTITSTTITPPTIDKYSGDLMYIDNSTSFNTSANKVTAIRTVLTF